MLSSLHTPAMWFLAASFLAGMVLYFEGTAASQGPSPVVKTETSQSAEAGKTRVLFPPHHGVVLAGTFNVIAQGVPGELKINGKPQTWDRFAPPLSVARVGLVPGIHVIRIGNERIDFSVGLNEEEHDGPKEWEVYRHHAIPTFSRCTVCHQTSIEHGLAVVGPPRTPSACFDCHPRKDFQTQHALLHEPLDRCQSCHSLHRSTRKSLLKDTAPRGTP